MGSCVLACEDAAEGARKSFTVTEQGRGTLAEKTAEVERILVRLTERAEGGRRGPSPQVARALGNLLAVLRHRGETSGPWR